MGRARRVCHRSVRQVLWCIRVDSRHVSARARCRQGSYHTERERESTASAMCWSLKITSREGRGACPCSCPSARAPCRSWRRGP
jgi:hypothetical protein